MAEPPTSIFNKRATEKLRSPDDLDKFLQVTNPGIWIVLAACVALLVGLLSWGVFGAVTTNVSSTGVSVEGKAMCFLSADDVAEVHVGDAANVGGESMRVATVAAVPVSRDEAKALLKSDYLVSALLGGDWAYQVIFEGDTSELAENVPLSVSITVEHVAPLSLVLGGNA